ncbi:MAG: hypothetical protein WCX86_12735 [Candidatus Hydrogenedentales bacterium]
MIYKAILYPDLTGTAVSSPLSAKGNYIYCADVSVSRGLASEFLSGKGSVYLPGYGNFSLQLEEALPEKNDQSAAMKYGAPLIPIRLVSADDEAVETEAFIAELAAFVDTGSGEADAYVMLSRLERYAAALGQADAPSGRLGIIRARRNDLEAEWATVAQALEDADALLSDLNRQRSQLIQCTARRSELRSQLHGTVAACAQNIKLRMTQLGDQIPHLLGKPLLSSGDVAAIKRKETQFETTKLQRERTGQELDQIKGNLDKVQQDPPAEAVGPPKRVEIPDELRFDILAKSKNCAEIHIRLDEVTSQEEDLDKQISQIQGSISTLPDFTRIAPNPVDWLNQLSSTLKSAVHDRYEEASSLERLQNEIHTLRIGGAEEAVLFVGIDNFAQIMQDHDTQKKMVEEKAKQVQRQLHSDRGMRDSTKKSMPGINWLLIGCSLFLTLLIGGYIGVRATPLLYPASMLFIAVFYFGLMRLRGSRDIIRLSKRIAEHHAEMEVLKEKAKKSGSYIEEIMNRAGCATIRELEARYDSYYQAVLHLRSLEEELAQKKQSLQESEERIPRLFERISATLESMDEYPESPNDVERCVGSAIGKYRIYHETVRRLADLRNRQQGLLNRRRYLEKEHNEAREVLAEKEKELRRIMRENGFYEEAGLTEVDTLLNEYYRYIDSARKNLSHKELLTRRCQVLENRLQEEEVLEQQYAKELAMLLEEFGVASQEAVEEAAENNAALADIKAEIDGLENRLGELLQGRDLSYYEQEKDGEQNANVSEDLVKSQREELARCEQDCEKLRREFAMLREERYQAFANMRGLNEIEEDLAHLVEEEAETKRKIKAAARAMALLEDTTLLWRDKHSAAISSRAQSLLDDAGLETEIFLNLNADAGENPFAVKTQSDQEIPADTLQLALRLAALEVLEDATCREAIIVDGSFQNRSLPVDGPALIQLLDGIAARRQLLLFSDNQELAAAAAKSENWSVLTIVSSLDAPGPDFSTPQSDIET